jgi:hypothetical protein
MSLMNQFNASSLGANLPNVSQGITGSYSATWMQIHVVDLFGCKVIELDHMSTNHWVNRIIGSKGEAKEVSLYDLELDDFLIAAKFATFGFFGINYDECYFIMLADHSGLTLTLVN